jgi:uncharacterized membrane protein YsdA (DUF1294 family)
LDDRGFIIVLPTEASLFWSFMIGWILSLGFVGFIIMGIDKVRARNRNWRVPGKILFAVAFLGGAFGVVVGSSIFHHKTRKGWFTGITYVAALAWLVILLGLLKFLGPPATLV